MKLVNAKKEFLNYTRGRKIKCAIIQGVHYDDERLGNYLLKENYSEQCFKTFLDQLDFQYNAGYGTQHLDGIVWFEDGTWLSRWEYDGSEGWQFNTIPKIPKELK